MENIGPVLPGDHQHQIVFLVTGRFDWTIRPAPEAGRAARFSTVRPRERQREAILGPDFIRPI